MSISSSINNLNVSNDSKPVEFVFLTDMSSIEDFTPIANSLQGLQQLDSHYNNFETILNSLLLKEVHPAKEFNLAFKWIDMVHEGEDSNTKTTDEPIQTTRKSHKGKPPKKVNIKSFKAEISNKH